MSGFDSTGTLKAANTWAESTPGCNLREADKSKSRKNPAAALCRSFPR